MRVSEVMTPSVNHVDMDTTLRGVAQIMKSECVGCVAVMNGVHLAGMVTDRDIVLRGVAEGLDPAEATAGTVMSEGVVTCFDDDEIEEAARQMKKNKIRRIVVLSRQDSKPVGILSLGDLSEPSEHRRLAGDVLEHVTA